MEGSKVCTKCGVRKGLGEFYTEKTHRDGYQSACKKCTLKRQQAHDQMRRGEIIEYDGKYYRMHKEKIKDRVQKYREEHKGAILKQRKGYRTTHKVEIANKKRKRDSTPDGKVARKRERHKRRAREKNREATLTTDQWSKILSNQKNRCNMCHKSFTVKYPPTTDHIIPLSAGGGLTFENVQALCGPCNSSKQANLDPQFIQTWL